MKVAKIMSRKQLQYVLVFVLFMMGFMLIDFVFRIYATQGEFQCRRNLEKVANAIKLYQKDSNEVLPHSLAKLKPYYGVLYRKDHDGIPICTGNRSETEDTSYAWPYVYSSSLLIDANAVPICWDSKSHRIDLLLRSPYFTRNVLFSDGHIETLSEQKFFALMHKYGVDDPNDPNQTGRDSLIQSDRRQD